MNNINIDEFTHGAAGMISAGGCGFQIFCFVPPWLDSARSSATWPSVCLPSPRSPTSLHSQPSPQIPPPPTPRSDHTAYPDNHPAQSTTSHAPAVPNPPFSYMDATIHDDTTITSFSLAPNPDPSAPTLAVSDGDSLLVPGAAPLPDVDPQILEALRSKDRIYVLKLGETFEALITERRLVHISCLVLPRGRRWRAWGSCARQETAVFITLTSFSPDNAWRCRPPPPTSACSSHRCSAYYRLTPESDPTTKCLFVLATSESRMYVSQRPATPFLTSH